MQSGWKLSIYRPHVVLLELSLSLIVRHSHSQETKKPSDPRAMAIFSSSGASESQQTSADKAHMEFAEDIEASNSEPSMERVEVTELDVGPPQ